MRRQMLWLSPRGGSDSGCGCDVRDMNIGDWDIRAALALL
jgi:hypothetical protein